MVIGWAVSTFVRAAVADVDEAGKPQVSGAMTALEVQAMVNMLEEGALPYPIRLISSEITTK